jgi:hypothetical protein
MTLHERADKLLSVREDLYEMHFYKVDREWLIDAMVDFALLIQKEISHRDKPRGHVELQKLISQAHKNITRIKGIQYSPTSEEIQNEINEIIKSVKPKKD